MIKVILSIVFGIAYSVSMSQINESTISFDFMNSTEELDIADSSMVEFGQLKISFSINDTLNLKSIQIQVNDDQSNPLMNILKTKQELYNSGSLVNGNLSIQLNNYLRTDNDYHVYMTYHTLTGLNEQQIEKSIIHD